MPSRENKLHSSHGYIDRLRPNLYSYFTNETNQTVDFGVLCTLEGKTKDVKQLSWFHQWRESGGWWGEVAPLANLDRLMAVITQPSQRLWWVAPQGLGTLNPSGNDGKTFQSQSCRKFPTTQVIRWDFPVMDVMEKGTVKVKMHVLIYSPMSVLFKVRGLTSCFFTFLTSNSLQNEALVNPDRVTQH